MQKKNKNLFKKNVV